MNKKKIQQILEEGEGQYIEFKEKLDKNIAKEIVAFANSSGGKILIGIDDNSKINGINITNKLKSQIRDIANNCDPKLDVSLEIYKNFLIVNVPVRFEIKGIKRIEYPQFPEEAYREAIVNAVIHRDYFQTGEIAVEKMKNIIMINNPGGTGINRIKDACKDNNNTVEFDDAESYFFVEIKVLENFYKKGIDKGVDKVVNKGVEKLSNKEQKILEFIQNNPKISKSELQKKGELSKKSVEYNIKKLKDKGILKHIGPAHGGQWKIIALKDL